MIEGLRQAVLYGSSAGRLWFRLRRDGVEVTTPDANGAKVTIYDTDGETVLVAETALTQSGSTSLWYYDLDASDTEAYPKAVNYRAKVKLIKDEYTTYEHEFFDIAAFPMNEPLVTTTEIDERRPRWTKPAGASTWAQQIEDAHLRLYNELRQMRDDQNKPVYPYRAIDRAQLYQVALAYTYRECAAVVRMSEEEAKEIYSRAEAAMPTLLTLDRDDDLIVDDDEEAALGPTLVH